MDAIPWFWIWIIAAAVLFIGEMFSLSFFLLPFAIGAVVAAILNAVGLDPVWHIVVFIIVSGVALAALRPFARRITKKASVVKVGAERLVGMRGDVVEGQSTAGEFRVMVGGEPWNARTRDGTRLAVGCGIEVLEVISNSLVVTAIPGEMKTDAVREMQAAEQREASLKTPLDAPHFVDVKERHNKE